MNKFMKFWYLLFAASIFLVDRITKCMALAWCQSTRNITPFLQCELVYNHGIVWGLLHEYRSLWFVLICIIITVIGCLVYYTINDYRAHKKIFAHIAIIIGACCNLIDRFVYGGVVDFIHLKYGAYSWPLFNLADVAIVLGVIWLCITYCDE